MEFQICKTALDAYRALKHDPHCKYSLCVIPLGSTTWPDDWSGRFEAIYSRPRFFRLASMADRISSVSPIIFRAKNPPWPPPGS